MSVAVLAKKAHKITAKPVPVAAVPVPTAPLWHLGKAVLGSQESFDVVQKAIDHLTVKAKVKQPFTDDEKEFLVDLFEAMWWGGNAKGMPEAAECANHYVHGGGKSIRLNPDVYRTSVIVKDSMTAMKAFIRQLMAQRIQVGTLLSNNPQFLRSPQIKSISQRSGRSGMTQGFIEACGALKAEDVNQRLKKTDHQFYLQANWHVAGKTLSIRWSVDSCYDFEPFERKSYYTDLPLGNGQVVKLPDGLSQYMTVLGIANAFNYGAEWHETEQI